MSRITTQYICVFLVAFINNSISATVDLEITTNPTVVTNLEVGDTGVLELIIFNNGPDDAGSNPSISFPISARTEVLLQDGTRSVTFFQNTDIPQDCLFLSFVTEPRPGEPIGFIYGLFVDSLPAGESITCYINYLKFSSSNSTEINWRVSNPPDDDPVSTNNNISVVFRGPIIQVPTLSFIGTLILALLTLFAVKNKFKMATRQRITPD